MTARDEAIKAKMDPKFSDVLLPHLGPHDEAVVLAARELSDVGVSANFSSLVNH